MLRAIVLFLLLCIALIPSEAVCVAPVSQNIQSQNFIINKYNADISFVQGDDENYYVVSQNNTQSEITSLENMYDAALIFGEDAINEDNILKHYVFNKNRL